ncbi:hypothetical protein BTR23_09230 [Alkalihalophilus pseudofirmus]|nr:hypothetical protein BTR23_09230 [Alkalihalophilus pseudofirmus]
MWIKTFKILLYVGIMFLVGYYYGALTKGTVFDNFFIMLLSFFILIFVFEWLWSLLKRKDHSEKNNPDEENEQYMAEVQQAVKKEWTIPYRNHIILVKNEMNKEQLYINAKLVDESVRKRWYEWLWSYHRLNGTLEDNGNQKKIKVKIGGVKNLVCKVFVDDELILKDKVKFNLFMEKIESDEKNENNNLKS